MDFDDGKWVWAAYKNGEANFEPKIFPPGLESTDFDLNNEGSVLSTLAERAPLFILEAAVEGRGVIPVGMVAVEVERNLRLFPHLAWFWWSSPRNRYESLFKFFLKYDEEEHFMVHLEKNSEADRICAHLSRLGILRKIGISYNWDRGKEVVLYEGKS